MRCDGVIRAVGLVTGLASVLLLAGCGDGGGGITSTPAPTYKTLDQLTGNQTFQTAGIHWQASSAGVTGQTADRFGSGPTFAYNDAAQSFTVTTADGTTGTFTQGDFQAGQSTANSRFFAHPTSTGQQTFNIGRPLVGGVQMSYLEIGQFIDGAAAGSKVWLAVGGVQTQAGDLPRTGSATYNAVVSAAVVNASGVNTTTAASTATFSADFGAGTVNTAVHLIAAPTGGAATDFGTFNGTGTIASGGPGFSGSFSGTTGAGFSGAFFGPQGAEIGYTFNLVSAANAAYGTVAGKKN